MPKAELKANKIQGFHLKMTKVLMRQIYFFSSLSVKKNVDFFPLSDYIQTSLKNYILEKLGN